MAVLASAEAANLVGPWLRHGGALLLLAGCRCGPLLLAVPLLGIAGRVVALLFGTLLVAPLLAPAISASLGAASGVGGGLTLMPLCLRELLIGGTLALAAALPWAVASSVGTLLDGVRNPRPTEPTQSREAARLYGALALALFFAIGGARSTVSALAASYELLPLPTPQQPLSEALSGSFASAARGLVLLSGRLLGLAIRLALPLLAAQLLAELLVTLPGRWLGLTANRPPRAPSPMRSLIGLGVLLLGAYALFPEFRKLLFLWPTLLRPALELR